ncbi:MAG: NADH-quinone oxidoreductase subunit D, partial [Capsulimonas sp.]
MATTERDLKERAIEAKLGAGVDVQRIQDEDRDLMIVNMGPQHPSTHGVLRVVLKLNGETVTGTDCVIGYLHRGIEKIAENRTYAQFAPYTD